MTTLYLPRCYRARYSTLCACLFVLGTCAQVTTEYKQYSDLYPNSSSIRLKQESRLNIGLKNGQFQITQDVFEEDLYLDSRAKYNAKQSLKFSTFYELNHIEAASYALEGNRYQEIKVTEFKERDDLDAAFYDDVKSLNFIFPRLDKGTKTTLKYRHTIKNPRFLNAHYFGGFYPILNNKLTVVAHRDIQMRFQEFNTEGWDIEYSEHQNGKNNIYTWTLGSMDEIKYENRAPTYKSILPHIMPIIASYRLNGKTINIGKDVSNLYDWYYTMIQDINKEPPSDEMVQIVNELVKDGQNELERVRAIYYWVQENIKYIAFEYALGGFVPREANEVLSKKYGDCKDNTSLLYKMLEIAGIQGRIAWIGTRDIPYSYSDVPTPSVDNHMILYYEYEGEPYYLDATGRFNPMEIPTSFIQGKEALVSLGKDAFTIKEVPIMDAKKSIYRDVSTLELQGDNVVGRSKAEFTGYTKINLYYELEKLASKDKTRDYYKWFFEKGNNSFLIEDFTESQRYSYDRDFTVVYGFKIFNHARTLDDEIYINLNLNKSAAAMKTNQGREMPFEHEYLDSYEFQNTLMVPKGYTVDYLPQNVELSNGTIRCSIEYELLGDRIIYRHNIDHNALVLDLGTQVEVNALVEKIEQNYKEVIVLKRI